MTAIPLNTGYRALIIDTQTGEGRWDLNDYPWEDCSLFAWTEGNFGCDCNRHLAFLWAIGDDENEDDDGFPCGHERYRVPYVELIPGGERIEVDGETSE